MVARHCLCWYPRRLVSTLSMLPHLLGGQQSTTQILEQLEKCKDANGLIAQDGAFSRARCVLVVGQPPRILTLKKL
jgi:hypothetical protein